MRNYEKIAISMPAEMLEVIELYAEFEGLSRSSAIGFLLARGLALESARTNGFDFDSPIDVYSNDNGETVTIKRSNVKEHKTVEWVMSCGRNKRREFVTVTDKDFEEVKGEK